LIDHDHDDHRLELESEATLAELADQVTQRLQDGERIDIDEWIKHHPGCADQIRRLLPTLRVLGQLKLKP
jgi:hypothetical protein